MSDYDYWDDDRAYDEAAATLKEAFRDSVKVEIKEQIEKLSTENADLREKLKNLTELERAAEAAKVAHEREKSNALYEAKREVRKEKLAEILATIDTRLYTVTRKYEKGSKCDLCDDNRQRPYTTPLGRDLYETCPCNKDLASWVPEEMAAHLMEQRYDGVQVWWVAKSRYSDDDGLSGRVLYPMPAVPTNEQRQYPSNYSFPTAEAAQAFAVSLNEGVTP